MAVDYTSVFEKYAAQQHANLADLQPDETYLGPAPGNPQSRRIDLLQFPFDAAPHCFVIMQGEPTTFAGLPTGVGTGSYNNFNKAYKLPLPTSIKDTTQVIYDHDFNFMDQFKNIASAGATALQSRASRRNLGAWAVAGMTGAGAVMGGLGFALNTMRTVTLSSPKFKMYDLEWRMYPKNRRESDMIIKIITGLKKGMLPNLSAASFNWLFTFPNVFMNFYLTGNQYLHKFKPAVLAGLTVDFNGGNAQPAFYRTPEGVAIPEGVVLQTSWIELELWISQDIKTDANGIPTDAPFDATRATLG